MNNDEHSRSHSYGCGASSTTTIPHYTLWSRAAAADSTRFLPVHCLMPSIIVFDADDPVVHPGNRQNVMFYLSASIEKMVQSLVDDHGWTTVYTYHWLVDK